MDNMCISKTPYFYVDEDFSFCLNTYIGRKYPFKILINRKIFKCRQLFTMANNMASSGLYENIILNKNNTYHRWHHCLCKEM